MTNEELTMSNEEAKEILINEIQQWKASPYLTIAEPLYIALYTAIMALEQQQQPCEDCISLNKLDDIITKAIDESENQTECQTLRWVLDMMSELPSVTPQPKVGKWIDILDKKTENSEMHHDECSNCGYHGWTEYSYCPNCGSKMEVEEE